GGFHLARLGHDVPDGVSEAVDALRNGNGGARPHGPNRIIRARCKTYRRTIGNRCKSYSIFHRFAPARQRQNQVSHAFTATCFAGIVIGVAPGVTTCTPGTALFAAALVCASTIAAASSPQAP